MQEAAAAAQEQQPEQLAPDQLETAEQLQVALDQLAEQGPNMALSDYTDGSRGPARYNAMNFLYEPYRGVNGRPLPDPEIIWETYSLPIETVKSYLKVEHNMEDPFINKLIRAAIEVAKSETNRSFIDVPEAVQLAILKTIAYWYENRTELNEIPAEAASLFHKYRRSPGL